MAREKKYTQTSGEWPCISETAAKFDMSTTLPLPTTHRERQNTREGTGEMGSVTSTAELRAPSESNTSPHQQGGVQSPNPPEIRNFASLNLGDLYMDLYSHIVNSARIWRLGIARIATLAQFGPMRIQSQSFCARWGFLYPPLSVRGCPLPPQ